MRTRCFAALTLAVILATASAAAAAGTTTVTLSESSCNFSGTFSWSNIRGVKEDPVTPQITGFIQLVNNTANQVIETAPPFFPVLPTGSMGYSFNLDVGTASESFSVQAYFLTLDPKKQKLIPLTAFAGPIFASCQ